MPLLNRSIGLALGLCLLATIACSETARRPTVTEACGGAYRDSSGKAQGFLLPQLSKSLAIADKFSLPPNAPANIVSIQCGRSALVPLLTDVKVLAAGYSFSVLSGGRIGTLEIVDGRLRFNMARGEMTEQEMEQAGILVDEGQTFLLELQSSEQ